MPYLVEGWTDDDESASNHWTNTEYHSCEVGRTRYVPSLFEQVSCAVQFADYRQRWPCMPDRDIGVQAAQHA